MYCTCLVNDEILTEMYRCNISSFHHKADEKRTLLGYYIVFRCNSVLTLWDNLSVPSSWDKIVLEDGTNR